MMEIKRSDRLRKTASRAALVLAINSTGATAELGTTGFWSGNIVNAIDSEKLNIPSASPIQEEKQGIEMVREEPSSTLDPRQANIYRSGAEEPVNDDLLNHPVDKPDVMDSSIEIAENETGQIMEETRPKTRVLAPPHNTAPSIPEEARPIENPAKPGKVQWDIDKVTTPGEWNDDNQEKVL